MSLYDVTEAAGLLRDNPDDILSPAHVAAIHGVALSTVRGWVRRGLLKPAVNVGSTRPRGARHGFRRGDVEAFTPPDVGRPKHAPAPPPDPASGDPRR